MGEAGKDANKSSGLKRIAKQVIDIIQTRPFMSYPQVAYFVVQLNLMAHPPSSDTSTKLLLEAAAAAIVPPKRTSASKKLH